VNRFERHTGGGMKYRSIDAAGTARSAHGFAYLLLVTEDGDPIRDYTT